MSNHSCIVARFERYEKLDEAEMELLVALESDVRSYPENSVLSAAGQKAAVLFSLQTGWACATRLLDSGQRQILEIYLPGQVMGLRDTGRPRTHAEIIALTRVRACPFPRDRLDELFERSPRLARILFRKLNHEHALLTERIINIGRRPAIERVGHFLLEMKARLRVSGNEYDLPLKQSVIADALAISTVHVSRTLGELRERGLVSVSDQRVVIGDLTGLVALARFDPDYLE